MKGRGRLAVWRESCYRQDIEAHFGNYPLRFSGSGARCTSVRSRSNLLAPAIVGPPLLFESFNALGGKD
jgi:hypothetical protein